MRRRLLVCALLVLITGLVLDLRRAPDQQVLVAASVRGIHFYQRTASPLVGRAGFQCRFTPTCSHYGELALQKYGIENLLVCGVTTEVCVNTTVREANDRGYRCVVLSDGCASYFPEFHEMGLKMIKAQGGIFGWVADSAAVLEALSLETSKTLA
jgi:hypothetical protein